MWHSARLRLLVCVAAGLAVVGLHAHGEGALGALHLPESQHVVAAHADVVAGTVATRVETLARDEAERSTIWFGSLFALGACALTLLAVGHRRRGLVLAGAMLPHSAALPSSSPRAPPLRVS